LQAQNAELRQQYGVKALSLFGPVARDEATSASDVDLLVEFDRPVDLGIPASLKPRIRGRVMGKLIRVT
jgi:hypothetical protein